MAKILCFRGTGGEEAVKTSVHEVAKYFLSLVDASAGSSMTHLKLQKLCYYAQAWHLVFHSAPLFEERIEAWVHGPVCPELFHKYKDRGYHNITADESVDSSLFTSDQIETMSEVWDAYGKYDGKYLEDLTHQEDPWKHARKGYAPGDHCTNEITHKAMTDFYSKMLSENGKE